MKRVTVYRDGSRSGVLVSIDKKEDKKKEEKEIVCYPEESLKRPKELKCDVVRFKMKDKWIAFVGIHNGRPYEIFTGIQDDDDELCCQKQ